MRVTISFQSLSTCLCICVFPWAIWSLVLLCFNTYSPCRLTVVLWTVKDGGGWTLFVCVFGCNFSIWECLWWHLVTTFFNVETHTNLQGRHVFDHFRSTLHKFPQFSLCCFFFPYFYLPCYFYHFIVSMEYCKCPFPLMGCARCWCFSPSKFFFSIRLLLLIM